MILKTFAWAAVWVLIFGCIYVLNAKETNQGLPLVADLSPSKADAPLPPWMLRTPCGRVDRRNLPLAQQRSA